MRLTRPTFGTEMTSSLAKSSTSEGALEQSLLGALGLSVNLGQALVLPQSFGYVTIFLLCVQSLCTKPMTRNHSICLRPKYPL